MSKRRPSGVRAANADTASSTIQKRTAGKGGRKGLLKPSEFFTAPQNIGRNSGILNAILTVLPLCPCFSAFPAARQHTAVRTNAEGDVKNAKRFLHPLFAASDWLGRLRSSHFPVKRLRGINKTNEDGQAASATPKPTDTPRALPKAYAFDSAFFFGSATAAPKPLSRTVTAPQNHSGIWNRRLAAARSAPYRREHSDRLRQMRARSAVLRQASPAPMHADAR